MCPPKMHRIGRSGEAAGALAVGDPSAGPRGSTTVTPTTPTSPRPLAPAQPAPARGRGAGSSGSSRGAPQARHPEPDGLDLDEGLAHGFARECDPLVTEVDRLGVAEQVRHAVRGGE